MLPLEEQLWAANAEVRRLQDAIKAAEQAALQARVDAVCTAIDNGADAHTVLAWIDTTLWSLDAEDTQAVLARVLNTYFVAADERSAVSS